MTKISPIISVNELPICIRDKVINTCIFCSKPSHATIIPNFPNESSQRILIYCLDCQCPKNIDLISAWVLGYDFFPDEPYIKENFYKIYLLDEYVFQSNEKQTRIFQKNYKEIFNQNEPTPYEHKIESYISKINLIIIFK